MSRNERGQRRARGRGRTDGVRNIRRWCSSVPSFFRRFVPRRSPFCADVVVSLFGAEREREGRGSGECGFRGFGLFLPSFTPSRVQFLVDDDVETVSPTLRRPSSLAAVADRATLGEGRLSEWAAASSAAAAAASFQAPPPPSFPPAPARRI